MLFMDEDQEELRIQTSNFSSTYHGKQVENMLTIPILFEFSSAATRFDIADKLWSEERIC
jgi:hypothetical protein